MINHPRHRLTSTRTKQAVGCLLIAQILVGLLAMTLVAGAIYVVFHFITKFW